MCGMKLMFEGEFKESGTSKTNHETKNFESFADSYDATETASKS